MQPSRPCSSTANPFRCTLRNAQPSELAVESPTIITRNVTTSGTGTTAIGGGRRRRLGSRERGTHDEKNCERDRGRHHVNGTTERHAVSTNGSLQRKIRNGGDGERDRDLQRDERSASQVNAIGRDENVDGPVPQIRAVAHGSHERERLHREQARDPAIFRANAARDEHEARDLGDPKSAVIKKRIFAAQIPPGPREHGDREEACHVEHARRRESRLRSISALACARPERRDARENGAGQNRARARVGSQIHTRDIFGIEQNERGGDRKREERDRHPKNRLPRAAFQRERHEERPHDVELLLDREAPRVLERRRRREEVPVALVRRRSRASSRRSASVASASARRCRELARRGDEAARRRRWRA